LSAWLRVLAAQVVDEFLTKVSKSLDAAGIRYKVAPARCPRVPNHAERAGPREWY